jgi:dTDP-glucose pyrophosphorylase
LNGSILRMISERCKRILIKTCSTLKEALKKIDETALQVLLVIDEKEKLLGVITDGDIRRAIIKGISFETPIKNIMSENPVTIKIGDSKDRALFLMKKNDIRHIPVIDENCKVIDIYLWKDFLKNGEIVFPKKNNKVIIMAGGKGTRLDPFTKILPKPLIPINEKPVIEVIMDTFKKYGFYEFYISLNYKSEMIKYYFAENPNDYKIEFIEENDYLGTIGALSLIKSRIKNTIIISNCDVVIDVNYDELLKYHRKNENDITILGISRHVNIPYGILNMKSGCADFEKIVEKPDYHFIVNSGIYVFEPKIIDLIPANQKIDAPSLISTAKEKGYKVQVYPMSCSWFDIGQWGEYRKTIEYFEKME